MDKIELRMDSIKPADLDLKVAGVVLVKRCQVSRNEDEKAAGTHKNVDIEMTFDDVTLREVFWAAMSPKVISWQRGARTNYDSVVDGSTVKITFKSAGRQPRDPVAESLKWAGKEDTSKSDIQAHIKNLQSLLKEK